MTELTVDPKADMLINQWRAEVNNVRLLKGEEQYVSSLESLANVMANIIRLGGHISLDRDEALFGQNDFMCYGIIMRRNQDGTLEFSTHS